MIAPKSVASVATKSAMPHQPFGIALRRRGRRAPRGGQLDDSSGSSPAGQAPSASTPASPAKIAADTKCDVSGSANATASTAASTSGHADSGGISRTSSRSPSSTVDAGVSCPCGRAPVEPPPSRVPVRVRARDPRDDGEVVRGRRRGGRPLERRRATGLGPASAPRQRLQTRFASDQQEPAGEDERADRLRAGCTRPSRGRPDTCRRAAASRAARRCASGRRSAPTRRRSARS